MSANNQLVILKKEDCFEIHLNGCVDKDFIPSNNSLIDIEDSLELAIKFANKFCMEEIVEYGLSIRI